VTSVSGAAASDPAGSIANTRRWSRPRSVTTARSRVSPRAGRRGAGHDWRLGLAADGARRGIVCDFGLGLTLSLSTGQGMASSSGVSSRPAKTVINPHPTRFRTKPTIATDRLICS
jgi:hypothetical protein